jgi:hypothetical protein
MALEHMSDEEVDQGIVDVHAELCGVWRRLLAIVGEHDRRELWLLSGSRTEAKHLEQVLSVSWRTANEWVRVARALERHPGWGDAFARGQLSLDQLGSMVTLAEAERPGSCSAPGPFDDPAPDPGAGPSGADGDSSGAGGDPSGDSSGASGGGPSGAGGGPSGDPCGAGGDQSGDPSGAGGVPGVGCGGGPSGPSGDPSGQGSDPSGQSGGSSGTGRGELGDPGVGGYAGSGRGADPSGADPGPGAGGDACGGDPGPGPGGHSAEELAALAGRLSPAQLARAARRARRKAREEADRLHRRRRLSARRDEASGGLWLEGVLFDDDAATVAAAIDASLARGATNPETGRYDPSEIRHADALVEMARAYLGATGGRDPRPTVVVHTDARVLSGAEGWAETTGGTPVAAETVRRLACFCKLNVVAEGPDATPVGVGRAQRLAPDWLAELVRHRDGGCRLCGSTTFIQIHHVVPWEWPHLGRTDLNNLAAQCSRDHHLVHEGGWRVEGDANAELRYISPTGLVIRSYPTGWPGAPERTPEPQARPMPAAPPEPQARPMPAAPPAPAGSAGEGRRSTGVATGGANGGANGAGPADGSAGEGPRTGTAKGNATGAGPPGGSAGEGRPRRRRVDAAASGSASGPPDEPRLFDDS